MDTSAWSTSDFSGMDAFGRKDLHLSLAPGFPPDGKHVYGMGVLEEQCILLIPISDTKLQLWL